MKDLCNNRSIRDCIWALGTPHLVQKQLSLFDPADSEQLCDALTEPHNQTEAIESFHELKSHFLGPYFEHIWSTLFAYSRRYYVREKNLQIHALGRTLGEFDLIIEDKVLEQFEHLELAIKFYLQIDKDGQTYWVGPNSIDRLDLKVAHLKENQMQLSNKLEARTVLTEKGVNVTSASVIIKGFLFHPFNVKPCQQSPFINREAIAGFWLSVSQISEVCQGDTSVLWVHLEKSLWISPLIDDEILSKQRYLSPEDSKKDDSIPRLQDRVTYWARVQYCGTSWKEIGRCFIVPDHWLGEALDRIPRQP